MDNFSSETMDSRRRWNDTFKLVRGGGTTQVFIYRKYNSKPGVQTNDWIKSRPEREEMWMVNKHEEMMFCLMMHQRKAIRTARRVQPQAAARNVSQSQWISARKSFKNWLYVPYNPAVSPWVLTWRTQSQHIMEILARQQLLQHCAQQQC